MAKRKLTLSVDEEVVARAHAYSEAHQTSISQIVSTFLDTLGRGGEIGTDAYTPAVRQLLGVIPSTVTLDEYRRHLDEKYDGPVG